jgi:hypothetical protein
MENAKKHFLQRSGQDLTAICTNFVHILYKDVFLNIFNLKFVVLELNVYKFQSNFVHTSVRSAS